jgi:hypothetical protein
VDSGASADVVGIFGNTFRQCFSAADVTGGGIVRMGNLANTSTADDGGNHFRSSNAWYIRNERPARIRAEGNDFSTTVRADIDAKIIDKLDNPGYGRVDFIPLTGGVMPTGEAAPILAVTAATASATPAGAEVLFALSAPAEVTVTALNVAGRPVATLAVSRSMEAGVQHVLWSGRCDSGTPAPAGRYLLRITARAQDAQQAAALTSLRLSR